MYMLKKNKPRTTNSVYLERYGFNKYSLNAGIHVLKLYCQNLKVCIKDDVAKVIDRIGSKYQNGKEKSFIFLDMKLSLLTLKKMVLNALY